MKTRRYRYIQKFSNCSLFCKCSGALLLSAWLYLRSTGFLQGQYWLQKMDWLVVVLILVLFAMFLYSLVVRLEVHISPSGISYRFLPFHRKRRYISWNDMRYCYLRRYNSFLEFGNRGYSNSWRGKGYHLSGNWGIQIVMKNSDRLLLGVKKTRYLEKLLQSYWDEQIRKKS